MIANIGKKEISGIFDLRKRIFTLNEGDVLGTIDIGS
jgi:hypothetical protein